MHMSALYSSSVFSCNDGRRRYCPVPLPPHDFLSESSDENSVETFLDKKYGREAWSYSLSPISFKASEIAESLTTIPVEILTNDHSLAGQYRSIALFVQRLVKVWDTQKFRIPGHVPERYMFSRVADFKLGEQIIPNISMRIRSPGDDDGRFRMIAVFHPVEKTQKIEVVKQEKTIKTFRCDFDRPVYIEGKWPNGLATECMEAI